MDLKSLMLNASEGHSVVSDSLGPHELFMEFSRSEYWSGSYSLPQGIFPTQGLTQVSQIAGGFFTNWAIREAQEYWSG